MIRGHKIRLYPNKEQVTYFKKACGTARFAYNWALERWKKRLEEGIPVTESGLRKELNAIKKEEYPWMYDVTKCAPQLAIKNDLDSAFRNHFEGRAEFPRFRRKGRHDSFSISNDQFEIKGMNVRIPNLGWVRMAEALRFEGKVIGAAVSRSADQWHIAVQVEVTEPQKTHAGENQAVGVDLGVMSLATLSDGTRVEGPKASRKHEKKLRRLNQELSRRQGARKGETKSKNFRKTQKKISRLHLKVSNTRADATHKLTTMLTGNYGLIGIEDLNVKGMMGNHRLARSVADMSFYEFRRQMLYKAEATGSHVVVADMWFASSKTCSACGWKAEGLSLQTREWECPACGASHDRDVNAAINLKRYATVAQRATAATA
jgi:putative transposase